MRSILKARRLAAMVLSTALLPLCAGDALAQAGVEATVMVPAEAVQAVRLTEWTGCLQTRTHNQGKYCGDRGSYAVAVTNTCNVVVEAEVCFKRSDGTGSCGRESDLRPGQTQDFWTCHSSPVYKYLGCEHWRTRGRDAAKCSIMTHGARWRD